MWLSELLPWKAKMVDDMCFIRSMQTEAINHEPAITFMQTGNQVTGRPCLGAWASYGLGSLNENLPTFVVMVAVPTNQEQVQAISARLWSSGYLSGEHAGVSFRAKGDPILYINNPPGVSRDVRRKTLDGLKKLNELNLQQVGDPETLTRIQQYEMAFKMQASVPEITDLSKENAKTLELYGPDVKKPGSFANSVLMARKLVEKGVRFVQIYHNNWDTHANVKGRLPDQCRDADQPCYALDARLETQGDARFHARHLGWRIRPDDLLAGRAIARQLWPRSSPALFHDVDGWRRRQGRHNLRRNRRFQLQHRQGPVPRSRLPRDDLAFAWHRSCQVHVQVSGAGAAVNWSGTGEGHQGIGGVAGSTPWTKPALFLISTGFSLTGVLDDVNFVGVNFYFLPRHSKVGHATSIIRLGVLCGLDFGGRFPRFRLNLLLLQSSSPPTGRLRRSIRPQESLQFRRRNSNSA